MRDRPPHIFGGTRAARIKQWEAIAAFGDPNAPLTWIAKGALWANEAGDDKERNAHAAAVLGLDGPKKSDENQQRLRDALDEFYLIHVAAYPSPPVDCWDDPIDADTDALGRLRDICAQGLDAWLYERVTGAAYGDAVTHRQFLERTTGSNPGLKELLEWALEAAKPLEPPKKKNSRGRVR